VRETSARRPVASVPDAAGSASSHLKGNLGTGGLLLTALAFNAPLAVMGAFVPLVVGLGLGAATPVVYLVIMALMLTFAVGLVTMARHMKKPGAFYTYVTAGLGRVVGLGAGFTALIAYILLCGGSYVASGVTVGLSGQPWWLWSVLVWLLVSTLTLFNVEISARILAVCLCLEVLVVLVWDGVVFADGGPNGLGLDLTAQLGTGSTGFALIWGVGCVLGFESIQVFREETRNPDRTIPRATYLAVIFLTGFYALGSWAYLVGFGTDAAVAGASAPQASFLCLVAQYAGQVTSDIANILLMTSGIAAVLAVQSVATRYCFALGRDGVLPSWLGYVHPRRGTPTRAAVVIALITLVLTVLPAVLDLDPLVTYTAMSGLSNWAISLMLVATAIAVGVFFRRTRGLETSIWKTLVAPIVAALGLGYVLVQATLNRDVLIGGDLTLATICIALLLIFAIGAMIYARRLKTRRPETWLRIGDQED
jgi:amino acid transporter